MKRRDEVLVAELVLRAVGLDVVLELLRALLVHVAGIPLVAEGGHGIDAPVDEDAELAVLVPRRRLVRSERFPGRLEGPGGSSKRKFLWHVLYFSLVSSKPAIM